MERILSCDNQLLAQEQKYIADRAKRSKFTRRFDDTLGRKKLLRIGAGPAPYPSLSRSQRDRLAPLAQPVQIDRPELVIQTSSDGEANFYAIKPAAG